MRRPAGDLQAVLHRALALFHVLALAAAALVVLRGHPEHPAGGT